MRRIGASTSSAVPATSRAKKTSESWAEIVTAGIVEPVSAFWGELAAGCAGC